MDLITRRRALGAFGAAPLMPVFRANAQPVTAAGAGLLARIQVAKKVRVGTANQLPFSLMNPDGTLVGVAPTMIKAIMTRLGVPNIEGYIANFGQLIPGMMAGRWDFVTVMTITKVRCTQVNFVDPFVLDGSMIFALKGTVDHVPSSFAEIAKLNVPVGTLAGGAMLRAMVGAGIPLANISQFPSDPTLMDGLVAGRIKFAVNTRSAVYLQNELHHLDLAIEYPVKDAPPAAAGPAFRKQDVDLYDAFQKELRAMKASGEFAAIVKKFGFEATPELLKDTPAMACSRG